MSYLIDTDRVVDFLSGDDEAVALLVELQRHGIAISVITHLEVMEGLDDARTNRETRRIYRLFLRRTRMIAFSRSSAERAASIRADLRRHRLPIDHRAMDILIAATAIEHGLTLVTRNVRDYADIPALRLHDGR